MSPVATEANRAKVRARVQRIGALAAAALLIGYLLISVIAANILSTPRREVLQGDPQTTLGLTYQDVSFQSRGDPIQLSGWFIPAPADAADQRVILLVHGKDGCRTCSFRDTVLNLAGALHARGFAVMSIDLRGHGESGAGRFTFGLRERHDIQGAVDWLLAQGFAPGKIGLLGESMGAASSIGATSEEPAIGALVSDSAYADLLSVLQTEFPRTSRLPALMIPSTLFFGRFFVGEDVGTSRPIDEIVKIAPRPVLIVHATGDQVIPVEHAYRLAQAIGAEPWIIPGTRHTDTFSFIPDEYAERIATFFDQNLK